MKGSPVLPGGPSVNKPTVPSTLTGAVPSAFFVFKKDGPLTKAGTKQKTPPVSLPKCTTGIQGLDEITGGGLPKGRPTLVCGGAGCGKTLLGIEFLVRGAMLHDEPGVFLAF